MNYKLTDHDVYKLVTMLFFIVLIIALTSNTTYSQSIAINNDGRYMIELSDEEKAIKTSSSLIKAKQDLVWETHINNIITSWKVSYIKDTKMYILYKHHVKYYESSTIAGIRSKYASDLLGREIKVQ